jgi:hypothetical protein
MAPPHLGPSTHRALLLASAGAALCLTACGGDEAADDPGTGGGAGAATSGSAAPGSATGGAPIGRDSEATAERQTGDLLDVAAERGVDYVNVSGEPDKPTILEANGAGVALFDLGGDGDLDLAFSQGLASLAALTDGASADLELFANDGRARFERLEGPGLAGWWTGLAAGDVDNDGDDDLIAGGFGGLELLRQNDGALERFEASGLMPTEPGARFTPGAEREPGKAPLWATSLGLADFDRDGVLDLYVGQYLELDPLDPPLGELGVGALSVPCIWKGHPVYCGPRGLTPQPDRVLKGLGDGRFEDRTAAWLPEHPPGFTLAVQPFDADSDGDTDVYVANDSVANLLWINDGSGRMQDVAPLAGVAANQDGMDEAGMGIAVGDVNRDGKVDLAVTNFSDEPTHLFYGSDRGFSTQTYRMGLSVASKRLLSWSTHLVDFDGDGHLDLFTANGHVYPQADKPNTGTRYGQADTLWRVGGRARVEAFEPTSEASLFSGEFGTRGSAFGDLDGDGRPDLVTCTIDGPARVGLNTFDGGHRLSLRLLGAEGGLDTGPRTPRDGTGARVVVVPEFPTGTPDNAQFALLAEVQRSTGYQSASTPWLHLGFGELTRYAAIRVLWPSGRVDELEAGDLDRRLTIREGAGLVASEAFAAPTVQ